MLVLYQLFAPTTDFAQSFHPLPECPESDPITAKIVFHDPIPRGEYNLVVSTRCGDGRDYVLRRIGRHVTVP